MIQQAEKLKYLLKSILEPSDACGPNSHPTRYRVPAHNGKSYNKIVLEI